MQRRFLFAAAALLLGPSVATAQSGLPTLPGTGCSAVPSTITTPFARVVVGGVCLDLAQFITPATQGKIWTLNTGNLVLGGSTIRVTATFNADPFINFGLTTTNATAGPTTYALLFGTPIVPGLYTEALSNGGVSVTSAPSVTSSTTPGAVYPTYISGYGTNGAIATNLGVDNGTTACTATSGTTTCTYPNVTRTFTPTFYNNLEALLTYNQTGTGSVASWSGQVVLSASTTVPEPSTFALLVPGVLAVGFAAFRRRRSA